MTYNPSIPNEFIHILNALSSLVPSTSSSSNFAASYFSSSVGTNPGQLLKSYAQNKRFNFGFPSKISFGFINGGTPNPLASDIIFAHLSFPVFSNPVKSH